LAVGAASAMSGQNRNGNEAGGEQEIENNSEECEKSLAAQEACEKHGEDCVETASTANAFNGLLPCWDSCVMLTLGCEEV